MSLLLSTGAFASSLSGAAPGMVLVSPTSITHSGTSATLGANGQVTFTAVTSLSLNGCFTADFDNYVVSVIAILASGNAAVRFRLRASGSDASGSNYTYETLSAESTTVSAARSTSQTSGDIGSFYATYNNGIHVSMYGPYLAQPTAFRSVTALSDTGASISDKALTHSLSTAYDGFTMYVGGSSFTGSLTVMGVRS